MAAQLLELEPFGLSRAERESHCAVDDRPSVNARDTLEAPHPATEAKDRRFDFDDVAGMHGPTVANAFDSGEERQPLPILRLRQDHDRANLRDHFGEDRGRQDWPLTR